MSNLYSLKNKIDDLENLDNFEEGNPKKLKKKLNILKELTFALAEEIEKLDFVRSIKVQNGLNLREEVQGFEKHLIQKALTQTGGHQTRAAKLLGVSITTLNSKIKRLNIAPNLQFETSISQKFG